MTIFWHCVWVVFLIILTWLLVGAIMYNVKEILLKCVDYYFERKEKFYSDLLKSGRDISHLN